jgi:hypothetical protein
MPSPSPRLARISLALALLAATGWALWHEPRNSP